MEFGKMPENALNSVGLTLLEGNSTVTQRTNT